MSRAEPARAAADLASRARGGRVAFSGFLDPAAADALVAELRSLGVRAAAWGGYPGATRRVVCALPEAVPEARPALTAVYAEGPVSPADLRVTLERLVPADRLGDAASHEAGASVVLLPPVPEGLLTLKTVAGAPVVLSEVRVEHAFGGSRRLQPAVVPSLRVDVLGARAFGVSRAYFAKGVAAGRVTVNGRPAGKSASAGEGDEVHAAGLGRFRVERVEGETRRGNLKVSLMVERA